MRQVLIEIYRAPDYIDEYGFQVFLDRYGEVEYTLDEDGQTLEIEEALTKILSKQISEDINRSILDSIRRLINDETSTY